MTEGRPKWRTGLAKDVPASETHHARSWPGIFGWSEITCDTCTWARRSNDFAGLVASAINHSPRVKVIDVDGQELADGAAEQRAARRRWDAGKAVSASEAIKERLEGGRMDENGKNDAGATGDQEEELGMSDRIRAASRVGLSGRRRELKERLFGKDQDAGEPGTEDETGDDAGEGGDAT